MRVVVVDRRDPDRAIEAAADWIRSGGVVIMPTDTLYALAADPTSPTAVAAVFDLKGRSEREPIPLVAASLDRVREWCGALPPDVERLARTFWPGPLSLIVDAPARVVKDVHAGRGSVAIRVPADPVTRALCEQSGGLLTATSANRTGHAPAARVDDIDDIVADRRVLVLDAGPVAGGPPSTIVDARVQPPMLVREGAIAWSRVWKALASSDRE